MRRLATLALASSVLALPLPASVHANAALAGGNLDDLPTWDADDLAMASLEDTWRLGARVATRRTRFEHIDVSLAKRSATRKQTAR
jgi:hypothetical protein